MTGDEQEVRLVTCHHHEIIASEVFEAVTGSGSSDFATLVAILSRRGGWCLIRGLAVNCYVEPVYTIDADIVVIALDK